MTQPATITPIILCGGAGRRLWPLSTPKRPKPFLNLFRGKSLLELTLNRVTHLSTPIIVCAAHHTALIPPATNATIITEPASRNTAPALCAALHTIKDDPIILILPADHAIPDTAHFHSIIQTLAPHIKDSIATIGIQPHHPSPHYGYIEKGMPITAPLYKVKKFTEKPNKATARTYIKSRNHLWNTGIFMAKKSTLIKAFQTHAPTILATTQHQHNFAQSPALSIDRAIIEPAQNVITIETNLNWADLGSWKSLLNALINKTWQTKQLS